MCQSSFLDKRTLRNDGLYKWNDWSRDWGVSVGSVLSWRRYQGTIKVTPLLIMVFNFRIIDISYLLTFRVWGNAVPMTTAELGLDEGDRKDEKASNKKVNPDKAKGILEY